MGWIVSCQRFTLLKSEPLVPQNVIFFESKVITDTISWDEVKLKLGGPQYVWYTYKKGKFGHRHAHRKKTEVMPQYTKELLNTRREVWDRSFLYSFRGTMALWTSGSGNASFQDHETINFCFRLLTLCCFVKVSPVNKYICDM